MIGRGGLSVVVGLEDDSGELGVHGDEGVLIDEIGDQLEFGFQVTGPYFSDLYRVAEVVGMHNSRLRLLRNWEIFSEGKCFIV